MKFAMLILGLLAFTSLGQFFEITNETGYDMYFVYISYASDGDWGSDWLGEDMFPDGETVVFNMDDYDWETELFDIQLEDADGDTYTFAGMDAEDYGTSEDENVFTVTLSDLD
ncbi:MAG: hypothetical protein J7K88_02135 [Candidatus Fermentibacteraceae bacterium]|nr:hypothetical protein [Candidatus Fermentibacteraceae bacterium]